MPHKIDKWQCDYCEREGFESEVKAHQENSCSKNPATMSCQTCDHYSYEVDNNRFMSRDYRGDCALKFYNLTRRWCAKYKEKVPGECMDD